MCLSLRRSFCQVTLPWSLDRCCSGGCPGISSHHHTGALELSQSDHQVPGHFSDQGPYSLIARCGWAAISRMSPGCSKLLPLKIYRGHCSLGNLYCNRLFVAFPRSVLQHIPLSCLWGLEALPSTSCFGFYLTCIVSCETVYSQCLHFQIMSNKLNLPQVGSNQRVETTRVVIKGYWV